MIFSDEINNALRSMPSSVRCRYSLWTLWTLIPLIGASIAFVHLSQKEYEHNKTALWGAFYIFPFILLFAVSDASVAIIGAAIMWIGGIIHAFNRNNEHIKTVILNRWAQQQLNERTAESSIAEQENEIVEDIETEDEEILQPEDDASLDELLKELNSYTGLESVKRDVTQQIYLIRFHELRKSKGIEQSYEPSGHMVFYGNPGTGKTTVARLIAKIYSALGLLSKGHLVETDRVGLVAGYVGQTAIKVKDVVSNALGGILFIDEAYSLSSGDDSDFGNEAIDTLLKMMEDNRDDLIVIVAGYTDKMEQFISMNPGLRSRFNKYLYFEDYTPAQLVQIFDKFCTDNSYVLADTAKPKLQRLFEVLSGSKDETFGNARLARNIFDQTIVNMASRVQNNSRLSKDALSIIKPEDIPEYNHPVEASTPDAAEIIRQPHEETADTLARNSEVSGETAISNAGDRSFNRKKAKVYIEELNSRYGHSLGKFNAEFRIYQARDAADVSIYAELHLDDNLFSLQIALGKDWNNGKPYIGFWITTNSSSMDFVDEWLIVNYPEELDKPVINRADPVNDFAVLCRKEFSTDMSDSSHEEQLDLFMTDEVNKRLDALFPILVLTLQEVG